MGQLTPPQFDMTRLTNINMQITTHIYIPDNAPLKKSVPWLDDTLEGYLGGVPGRSWQNVQFSYICNRESSLSDVVLEVEACKLERQRARRCRSKCMRERMPKRSVAATTVRA